MRIIRIYKGFFLLTVEVVLLFVVSCSDGTTELSIIDPDESERPENIKGVLESAIIKWGISQEEVMSSMKGYIQVGDSKNDMLLFKSSKGRQGISYYFNNGKLCATSVVFPTTFTDVDLQSLWKEYSFVGELGGGKVYNNQQENTMVTVWNSTECDSTLCAVGFAPIKSDSYKAVEPIVVTSDDAVTDICSATISGKITGVDKDVEVGIIYGRDGDLSELNGRKSSTTSRGNFSVTIKGLIDEQTYYYRAYALVDDIYYLGDIKSLFSKPITYTIDGNTFKMVQVKGDKLPVFYIMQTELPSNSDITIGTFHIGKLNKNDDPGVTKAEFRTFLKNIIESTGVPFRLPTKEEWQYAARGGYNESNSIYSGSDNIENVAWYQGNSGKKGHAIATKSPNSLELYDMSGNYSELCNETDDIYYVDGPLCGGSWNDAASNCKVTSWVRGSTSGKIPNSNLREKNAFDANYITIRLVYSAE